MTVGEIMDEVFSLNTLHSRLSAIAESDNELAELCDEAADAVRDYVTLLRKTPVK